MAEEEEEEERWSRGRPLPRAPLFLRVSVDSPPTSHVSYK